MTDENTEQSRNKALVKAGFERWRDGTGSAFDLLHPEAEWTIVGSSPLSKTYSKPDFMEQVVRPFNALLKSPAVPTVHGVYADGDMVIVLFDATAVAKDGLPYRNRYAWFLQMKDGQVVRGTAFFDTRDYDALWTRVAP
jgi:ketosteroid isomerase-like protein